MPCENLCDKDERRLPAPACTQNEEKECLNFAILALQFILRDPLCNLHALNPDCEVQKCNDLRWR